MVDVMDRLILEHKNIPVYAENLYKWTPEPTVLKQDICWDNLITEDLKCPYCENDDKPKKIILDSSNSYWDIVEIYISRGFLFIQSDHYDFFDCKKINFCPMCGRQLK